MYYDGHLTHTRKESYICLIIIEQGACGQTGFCKLKGVRPGDARITNCRPTHCLIYFVNSGNSAALFT